MIEEITFTNYKSFKEKQRLELKPLTILIGKNSSGKSAVAKLPTLISNSLTGRFPEPLLLENNDVHGLFIKSHESERGVLQGLDYRLNLPALL